MSSDSKNNRSNMYGRSTDLESRFRIIGTAVMRWDHVMSENFRGAVEVTGLSLREPTATSPEFLVVVRGFDGEGGPVVGFHSALTPSEALAGAAERVANGTINWKPDAYRK